MLKFFKKRIFKKMSADGNSTVCSYVQDPNEREIVFSTSTEKEKGKSKKHSKRKTALYIPGFRKTAADIKFKDVKTSDGQLIIGQEVEWTELDDTMIDSLGTSGIWGVDTFDDDDGIPSEAEKKSNKSSKLVRGHSFNGFVKKDLERNKENIKLNSTICAKDLRNRNHGDIVSKDSKENMSSSTYNINENSALNVSFHSKSHSKGKKCKKSPLKTLENTGVMENKLHGSEKQFLKRSSLREKSSGPMSVRSLSFKSPKKRPSPDNKENFTCVESTSFSSPNIKLQCSYVLDSPHQLVSPQARYPKERISPDTTFKAKPVHSNIFSNSNSAFKSYKLIKSTSQENGFHCANEEKTEFFNNSFDLVEKSCSDSQINTSCGEIGENSRKCSAPFFEGTQDGQKTKNEMSFDERVVHNDCAQLSHQKTLNENSTANIVIPDDNIPMIDEHVMCAKSTYPRDSSVQCNVCKDEGSNAALNNTCLANPSNESSIDLDSTIEKSGKNSLVNSTNHEEKNRTTLNSILSYDKTQHTDSVPPNVSCDERINLDKHVSSEDECEFQFKKPDYSLLPSFLAKRSQSHVSRKLDESIYENLPNVKDLDFNFLSQLNEKLHILERQTCDRINFLEDSDKPDYSLLPCFSPDSLSDVTDFNSSASSLNRDADLNISCMSEHSKSHTLPHAKRKSKHSRQNLKESCMSKSVSFHETVSNDNKFSLTNALEGPEFRKKHSKPKLMSLSDSINLQRSKYRHSDRFKMPNSKLSPQKEQSDDSDQSHSVHRCRNLQERNPISAHSKSIKVPDKTKTHSNEETLDNSVSNLNSINGHHIDAGKVSETDIDENDSEEQLVAPLSVSYAGSRTEDGQSSTPDILLFNRPEIKSTAPRTVQTNVDEFFTGTLVTCQPARATTRKIVYETLDTSDLNQSVPGRDKKATVRKIVKLQKTTLEHVQNYLDEDPLSDGQSKKLSRCPRSPPPRKVSHMSRRSRERSPSPTFSPGSPCGSSDSSSSLEDFYDQSDWTVPQSPSKKGRNTKMPYSKFREKNRKRDEPYSRPDSFPPSTENSKLSDQDLELLTRLHTLCNGQRVVKYLNSLEAPMMIKHYPPPKEASRISWCENIAVPLRTPTATPCKIKPEPKPILQQRSENSTFPYMEDVPSPIVITKTRRSSSLGRRAKRKQKSFSWNP